jgi:hypothetical protein
MKQSLKWLIGQILFLFVYPSCGLIVMHFWHWHEPRWLGASMFVIGMFCFARQIIWIRREHWAQKFVDKINAPYQQEDEEITPYGIKITYRAPSPNRFVLRKGP